MSFLSHTGYRYIKKWDVKHPTSIHIVYPPALLLAGCPPAEPASSWGWHDKIKKFFVNEIN